MHKLQNTSLSLIRKKERQNALKKSKLPENFPSNQQMSAPLGFMLNTSTATEPTAMQAPHTYKTWATQSPHKCRGTKIPQLHAQARLMVDPYKVRMVWPNIHSKPYITFK